ncbi:MAG: GyrI-like domain-containing protein, partial [Raoultibacter sp.]
FEYKVPPLEGLWWNKGPAFNGLSAKDKSTFLWISMIRQPDFVTPAVFAWACDEVARKKPRVDLKEARFEIYEEGLCVQIMHKGPYDDEPVTIEKLETFVGENGYSNDFSNSLDAYPIGRRHHEVYLGDPRRTKPENLRTVIRHPIRKNA